MGQQSRPVEGRPDQEEQALLIRRTRNGPTADDEQQLLLERFGAPDMAGVFTASDAPTEDDQDDEQPAAEELLSGQSATPLRTTEHTDGGDKA